MSETTAIEQHCWNCERPLRGSWLMTQHWHRNGRTYLKYWCDDACRKAAERRAQQGEDPKR